MEWDSGNGNPYLEIVAQPQPKFRFRYKSEMTGKHGKLLGVSSTCASTSSTSATSPPGDTNNPSSSSALTNLSNNGFKTYPTVKLHNWSSDAVIRCSLVCENSPYYPHPHQLEASTGFTFTSSPSAGTDEEIYHVEIPINADNDYTAVFQGLNIIYVAKKEMRKQLLNKIDQLGNNDSRKANLQQIDDLTLSVNLNVVALYFEAFVRNRTDQTEYLLCPPVISNSIQNNKSTQTGDLRIVRIDKHTSCCTGDEEVFILVEKVDKHNIQIKFFQENDKGVEIWKAYGRFSKLDVHHQYAIVFKTPPYRSKDIDTEVEVYLQLERPSDGSTSTPIPFKYKPIERLRKMPKRRKSRSGNDNQGPGRSSRPDDRENNNPPGFPEEPWRSNPPGADEDSDDGNGNQPSTSSSSARQGSNQTFPLDESSIPEEELSTKALALHVALSVCKGLHTWAETSDFNCVLQRLRHLLCLVNESGNNALHTAILNHQREPFMKILKTVTTSSDISYMINEPNMQSLTPLTLAVLTNAEYFVEELINAKADIRIPNLEGDTPVHLAVKEQNINILKIILRSNFAQTAINQFNYSNQTPLHLAVGLNCYEAIEILCNAQANLSVQDGTYGRTPLHMAIEKASVTSALLLLRHSASAELGNIQNYRGDTPLHCAASSGFSILCALLLYYGADPNIENHIGKESEDEEDENSDRQTVFDIAANAEVMQILIGSPQDWEITLRSCSNLIVESSRGEQGETEIKILSVDSIHLDSGIDIKDLTI